MHCPFCQHTDSRVIDSRVSDDGATIRRRRECEACGVRKMIAVIGDSSNVGSVGVHRAAGFAHVGTLRSVGWKFGRWLDVVMMEKSLGAGDTTSPE